MGGRFIAAQIQKFIAVADDGFPLLFKQRLELGNVLNDDGNADIPERMVASSLSKSSGKLTLANSSIKKCTGTGRLPPCIRSAE